jgi:hypothetical protein
MHVNQRACRTNPQSSDDVEGAGRDSATRARVAHSAALARKREGEGAIAIAIEIAIAIRVAIAIVISIVFSYQEPPKTPNLPPPPPPFTRIPRPGRRFVNTSQSEFRP